MSDIDTVKEALKPFAGPFKVEPARRALDRIEASLEEAQEKAAYWEERASQVTDYWEEARQERDAARLRMDDFHRTGMDIARDHAIALARIGELEAALRAHEIGPEFCWCRTCRALQPTTEEALD